jgi:urease subunit gamma/beta
MRGSKGAAVHLTPADRERLLVFQVSELARRRLARGLRLTAPEATAMVADAVCEAARDGARLADALAAGRSALRPDQVLPGVAEVVGHVAVEAVFDDGTRLAVVDRPFGPSVGDPAGIPRPGLVDPAPAGGRDPGAAAGTEDVVTVAVTNTAAVPIIVTSHFHFFEVNPRLRFDRAAAYGRHLAVPSGSHVRFDPGGTVEVGLVRIAGARVVVGFAGLVDGRLDAPGAAEAALAKARACGFLDARRDPGAAPGHGVGNPSGAAAAALRGVDEAAR